MVADLQDVREQRATGSALGRVLVVDDDEHIRAFLSEALAAEGYEVATAADGFDALGEIRRRPPDVILLDLLMPALDGRGFLDLYRSVPGPHAPVIAISAVRSAAEDIAERVEAVMLKPLNVDRLVELVRHHLGQ